MIKIKKKCPICGYELRGNRKYNYLCRRCFIYFSVYENSFAKKKRFLAFFSYYFHNHCTFIFFLFLVRLIDIRVFMLCAYYGESKGPQSKYQSLKISKYWGCLCLTHTSRDVIINVWLVVF